MWRWNPQDHEQEEASKQAMALLAALTGTSGERFVWTLTGSRGSSTRRSYVVRLPPQDIVVVTENNNPLSIGKDGALLFMDKFRLLKGDFDIVLEGEFGS